MRLIGLLTFQQTTVRFAQGAQFSGRPGAKILGRLGASAHQRRVASPDRPAQPDIGTIVAG